MNENSMRKINMRTIIYVGGFELPDKNAAAQRVVSNAKALRELGYTIVFIDIDKDNTRFILDTKTEMFGFERYSMKYTNKRLVNIEDFKFVFDCYKKNLYAVIAYNYPGVALDKIRIICKKYNIKIIADCTEWYGAQGENIIKKAIKGLDSFIRMNIVQPKLDGMIAISRYLENYYKDKLPTICIPPLTDILEDKWKSEEIKRHKSIRIVYAGNPGKDKDKINIIIEVLAKCNIDFKFLVLGITKDQFLTYYPEDKYTLECLNDKVIFKGRIPHKDVLHYIKQADFSMFYREIKRVTMAGFPTKFAEAISCGTPVITNKTSDLEEYLIEGVNGYWINEEISDLLNMLEETKLDKINMLKNSMERNTFDYRKYLGRFEMLFPKKIDNKSIYSASAIYGKV